MKNRHENRFILSGALFIATLIIVSSLWWSKIPIHGYSELGEKSSALKLIYFSGKERLAPDGLLKVISDQDKNSLLIGSNAQLKSMNDQVKRGKLLYPVYDDSVSAQRFGEMEASLPSNSLKGFDKTVYFTDYKTVRLFFLNGERLKAGTIDAESQWDWLKRNANGTDSETIQIAIWNEGEMSPAIEERLSQAHILAALVGGKAYFLQDQGLKKLEAFYYLNMEVKGKKIEISAKNRSNEITERFVLETEKVSALKRKVSVSSTSLIPSGQLWRYKAGGQELRTYFPPGYEETGERPNLSRYQVPAYDWRSVAYDDQAWEVGQSPIGYHREIEVRRMLQSTLTTNASSPTVYFRKTFELDVPLEKIVGVSLILSYEDGFAAYINGEEVARNSLPGGILSSQSLASPGGVVLNQKFDITAHANKLAAGSNVLSIEVHRSHPGAPNLLFDAEFIVERER